MKYVVVSLERLRGELYWRPARAGYTNSICQAGLYSPAETIEIIATSSGGDFAVPLDVAVAIGANALMGGMR